MVSQGPNVEATTFEGFIKMKRNVFKRHSVSNKDVVMDKIIIVLGDQYKFLLKFLVLLHLKAIQKAFCLSGILVSLDKKDKNISQELVFLPIMVHQKNEHKPGKSNLLSFPFAVLRK